jgi:pimeloyl-ACP methyl ester carboxylesterase
LGTTEASEAARIEAPKADQDAISHSIRHMQSMNITEVPNHLEIPCLLIYGQDDPVVEQPKKEQIAKLPKTFHHIFFENAGHFPMLDMPNQFHRLMVDFLSLSPDQMPHQLELKEEWKRRVR